MNKFHHVLLLLLWMLSLHGSGIFLFYEGFFLTRYEISDKSKCSDPPTSIPLEILNKHLKSTEEVSEFPLQYQISFIMQNIKTQAAFRRHF